MEDICFSVCEKWFPKSSARRRRKGALTAVSLTERAARPRYTVENQRVELKLAFNKSIRIVAKARTLLN